MPAQAQMPQTLRKQSGCIRCKQFMAAGEAFVWESKSWLEKGGTRTVHRPAHAFDCLAVKYEKAADEERLRVQQRADECFDRVMLPVLEAAGATVQQIAEARQIVTNA